MSESLGTGSDKPFLVVSDVHIGAVPAETERAFRAFLDHASSHASGLLLNGDLFDVWAPARRFVLRQYVRVLAKLADVVEAGLPVYFVGGNHDAPEYVGGVLEEDAGVTLLDDPARVTLGRFHTLVAHGDGVRRFGGAYRKEHPVLRAALRSQTLRTIAERLMPIDWLYERVSPWSRVPRFVASHQRGESTGPKPAAPRTEAWAREQLSGASDLDVVLVGHSHRPAWIEVEPGRYYVNTGDWIEHMTYALLPIGSGEPELRRWPSQELVLPIAVKPLTVREMPASG